MKKYVFLTLMILSLIPLGCGERKAEGESESTEKKAAAPEKKKPEIDKKTTRETPKESPAPMPEYSVKLETTKGDIIIDVHPEWAPLGAKRFHELVEMGYFTNSPFFRVLDGFMAQTGINADPEINKQWRTKRIKDDKAKESNQRGTVSFATSGPNSRTTQFFINYGDNAKLDPMGFSPFGKVKDMTAVDKLYSEYGEGAPRGNGPSQKRLQLEGKPYWEKEFPKLDYIKSASLVK